MKYTFESNFAPYITGMIEQKHSDGFSYFNGEKLLRRFDIFCKERFPESGTITRELVMEWSIVQPTEGMGFRDNRVGVVRQLSLYILSLGLEAYVPQKYSKIHKPSLYIPTREEMRAFFIEMDLWKSKHQRLQRFIDECKMMCLLYYCCGLRLSEAIMLKKEHVDWKTGTLTIYASKGHKDRLVYLPKDGIAVLAEYQKHIETVVPNSPWMFPGVNPNRPVSDSSVENRFNACWAKLSSSSASNKHPTPHCLRHAFVVERLNEWMLQGIDIGEMLIYLSRYLGHTSPAETHYYYHLVQKAFAVIKQKDTVSNRVIPEVVSYEED